MQRFKEGSTYYGRSFCDYEYILEITVARRTPKTIVTTEGKRLKIRLLDDTEYVKPRGNYSMAPMICAGRARFPHLPAVLEMLDSRKSKSSRSS